MIYLLPQPLPPGGRGTPISLRSGLRKNSLEVAPTSVALPEPAMTTEVGGQPVFNPPHRHQKGNEQHSATALVRAKQPSSNKPIVQLFQTLLSTFGTDSTLGSQLQVHLETCICTGLSIAMQLQH